ncbi:MAG: glycosyltransferase family 39 protein [Candidatus Falkowbacteria bacterium]
MKLKTIRKFFTTKNGQGIIIVALAALLFAVGAGSFNYLTQADDFVKWTSPDENANYVFAKLYADSGRLSLFEEYNLRVGDIMHPRSMRSSAGEIKPVSFWGIILIYGKIGSLLGTEIIPYLTPIVAGIGLIFFYLLIKKIFGRINALLSVFLLASFPPFIYYSAHSMFHNVLFTVLTVIGLYFTVTAVCCPADPGQADKSGLAAAVKRLKYDYRSWVLAALGGTFIGLAAITRTSEILWLAPLLTLMWIMNIKRTGVTKLAIFLSFIFFASLPALYYNQVFNGGWLYGGYAEMNRSLDTIARAGTDIVMGGEFLWRDLAGRIFDNIFHFGFHPRQSLMMFYRYFINMFPWIFWPGMLGLFLFLFKYLKREARMKRKHKTYLSVYFVIVLILIFYYGSWKFHDNPDPNQFTIGNSYTRYWLPVYLGFLPFVSLAIMKFARAIGNLAGGRTYRGFYRGALRAAAVFVIVVLSLRFVLWGSDEGLFYQSRRQETARGEFGRIIELTEDNAVIITRYHDKLLFPERKVIVGLFDSAEMVSRYSRLARFLPLYYYNFVLPEKDIEYLNTRRLGEAGLSIEKIENITEDFALYRLNPK